MTYYGKTHWNWNNPVCYSSSLNMKFEREWSLLTTFNSSHSHLLYFKKDIVKQVMVHIQGLYFNTDPGCGNTDRRPRMWKYRPCMFTIILVRTALAKNETNMQGTRTVCSEVNHPFNPKWSSQVNHVYMSNSGWC